MPITGGIGDLIIILVGLMVLASGMWMYRKKVR
ncbi:LPXTG cell wall anchor domain-containing protein [Pediococcus parvulus]|nr:LPXTG cell wall anchor domain-containing protein [Pediococcus parvulus]